MYFFKKKVWKSYYTQCASIGNGVLRWSKHGFEIWADTDQWSVQNGAYSLLYYEEVDQLTIRCPSSTSVPYYPSASISIFLCFYLKGLWGWQYDLLVHGGGWKHKRVNGSGSNPWPTQPGIWWKIPSDCLPFRWETLRCAQHSPVVPSSSLHPGHLAP